MIKYFPMIWTFPNIALPPFPLAYYGVTLFFPVDEHRSWLYGLALQLSTQANKINARLLNVWYSSFCLAFFLDVTVGFAHIIIQHRPRKAIHRFPWMYFGYHFIHWANFVPEIADLQTQRSVFRRPPFFRFRLLYDSPGHLRAQRFFQKHILFPASIACWKCWGRNPGGLAKHDRRRTPQ